ncbi:MAG TPA: GntR family transcriptional regulator [Candidatus Limnocylindrales bacterium]
MIDLPRATIPSLAETTATILRNAIFAGSIKPGSRLREPEMAAMLGISRAPLREALRILSDEQLVVISPHRGARVVNVTPADYLELLAVRGLLEPYAVEHSLAEHRDVVLHEIRDLVAEMRAAATAADPASLASAHTRFHASFYVNCGNRTMVGLWSRLQSRVHLHLVVHQTTYTSLQDLATGHGDLLAIVEYGDRERISEATLDHLNRNVDLLLATLQPQRAKGGRGRP